MWINYLRKKNRQGQSIMSQTRPTQVIINLERRVSQLSTLSDVVCQLTGTLETEPLLQKIPDSAVTILDCESGRLFLVYEATGELVFKAASGLKAQNLPYRRLTAVTEIITEAVQSRQAVIRNNVKQVSSKSGSSTGDTEFVPRSSLVVPIQVNENIFGVLEATNRKDGLPFNENDQYLLSAFSGQAAVAIANARLYHQALSANEAKSEFVSLVAHELKTPMTSIQGYTELLAKGAAGKVTEMQANFLGIIHLNVERMSALISDLNDSSMIEAGVLRLDFKAIDFAGVLGDVLRSTKPQMEVKQQSANLLIPSDLPKIQADPARLVQILSNLVSNANTYAPVKGLITIGAEKSTNLWDPGSEAEVLHVWVQDDGIGIRAEAQNKIFQKFFRSDDLKVREVTGSGLGLNITKSLIELMGGRIWFESEFRKGTTFHFSLPLADS
jgi:signal transduction histidine kinase